MKLPALYLIDSILKNVGGEYVQIFSQDIFKNFVKCFNEVDDPVKQKFLKVLETWSLIFSADIIESIKSTVLGTKVFYGLTILEANYRASSTSGE